MFEVFAVETVLYLTHEKTLPSIVDVVILLKDIDLSVAIEAACGIKINAYKCQALRFGRDLLNPL